MDTFYYIRLQLRIGSGQCKQVTQDFQMCPLWTSVDYREVSAKAGFTVPCFYSTRTHPGLLRNSSTPAD